MAIKISFILIKETEILTKESKITTKVSVIVTTETFIAISVKEIGPLKATKREIALPKKVIVISLKEIAISEKEIWQKYNQPTFNRERGNRQLETGNHFSQSFGCSKMTSSAIGQIVLVKGRCRRSKRDRGDGRSYVLHSDSADPLIFRYCPPNR